MCLLNVDHFGYKIFVQICYAVKAAALKECKQRFHLNVDDRGPLTWRG